MKFKFSGTRSIPFAVISSVFIFTVGFFIENLLSSSNFILQHSVAEVIRKLVAKGQMEAAKILLHAEIEKPASKEAPKIVTSESKKSIPPPPLPSANTKPPAISQLPANIPEMFSKSLPSSGASESSQTNDATDLNNNSTPMKAAGQLSIAYSEDEYATADGETETRETVILNEPEENGQC